MKFKYCFLLAAIILILFALGNVAASENTTSDDISMAIEGDSVENQNALETSSDDTDVSVRIDFEDAYKGNDRNRAGCEVPWTITVKVTGQTALNTKVHEVFSNNLEYVSHEATIGSFNPATGIWDIGDLTSTDNAVLKVVTKLKEDGKFTNTADATTDSHDINSANNHKSLTIKTVYGKTTGNITKTAGDKKTPQHSNHYGSSGRNGVAAVDNGKTRDKTKSKSKDSKSSDNQAVAVKSTFSTVSKINEFLTGSIDSIINSSDEKQEDNESLNGHVGAVNAHDYTKIPFVIFALFLVVLVAIVAYDKIKH